MKSSSFLMLAGAACLSACVPQPDAPPPPAQSQPAQPPAAALPPPPPASADWRDIALTPGDWSYGREADGSSAARFGTAGTEPLFVVRCEPSRQVRLSLGSRASGAMTLRTSFGARALPLTAPAQPTGYSSAALPATDPLLDGMAFSRGRFTVEVPNSRTLVLPAWAEVARVVEDCRS
jgi:hypothetical protein